MLMNYGHVHVHAHVSTCINTCIQIVQHVYLSSQWYWHWTIERRTALGGFISKHIIYEHIRLPFWMYLCTYSWLCMWNSRDQKGDEAIGWFVCVCMCVCVHTWCVYLCVSMFMFTWVYEGGLYIWGTERDKSTLARDSQSLVYTHTHTHTHTGSGDIVSGNLKLILGLIWTLILHYQISMGFGIEDDGGKKSGLTAKQALLDWLRVRHLNWEKSHSMACSWSGS